MKSFFLALAAGMAVSVIPAKGAGEAAGKARTFPSLDLMHESYTADFASRPGFGASRVIFLPPQDFLTLDGGTYRFAAPDLLGLADEPVAYTRRHPAETIAVADLSRKESRARLQRRPLTDDELRAVAELRRGQNLVTLPKQVAVPTEHGTNHVAGLLAVGALRARAQCAECHDVKEGTLLGAFAYTLVPTNSVAPRTFAVVTAKP